MPSCTAEPDDFVLNRLHLAPFLFLKKEFVEGKIRTKLCEDLDENVWPFIAGQQPT